MSNASEDLAPALQLSQWMGYAARHHAGVKLQL